MVIIGDKSLEIHYKKFKNNLCNVIKQAEKKYCKDMLDKNKNERHSESADFAKSLNFQVESWEKLGKVGNSWEKWEKVGKSGKKWEKLGKVGKNG